MRKRIAIIFAGDTNNIRGAFIASHNRIKNIIILNHYEIDLFLIQTYKNWFTRLLINEPKCRKDKEFSFEGLIYNNLWLQSTIIDYLMRKIKKNEFIKNFQFKKWAKLFIKYDLISVHSKDAGYLSLIINKKLGIPYTVTWHGSDIHTHPFINQSVFDMTKSILESASMNFFVSTKLMEDSKKISNYTKCTVLYNGVNRKTFYSYSDIQKNISFSKFSILPSNKNILFIGDFWYNKNINCLPEVLSLIKQKISNVELFIAGYEPDQNKMVTKIMSRFHKYGVIANFLGQILPEDMPSLINCMDLCILPSLNEGLPLFAIESIACKIPFVGSRVGGIAEVVGEENTVPQDEKFNVNFADLCTKRLLNPINVELSSLFDWTKSSRIESNIYKNILGIKNS